MDWLSGALEGLDFVFDAPAFLPSVHHTNDDAVSGVHQWLFNIHPKVMFCIFNFAIQCDRMRMSDRRKHRQARLHKNSRLFARFLECRMMSSGILSIRRRKIEITHG